ncbi:MAG: 6,7-dimethyl-8-ribityllumazine synthase [Paludibacter sp.]|jgi:6,7-dimethyl-8-ribityllumazine synthase|nr:6,7-dimethyl-8-ribityllumazine synthase [Paludibacter sp.]
MATQYQNLSDYNAEQMPEKENVLKQQYAVVVADWNPNITHTLLQGAIDTLIKNGVKQSLITIVHVPGTFELTFAAKQLVNDYYCMIENKKIHKYAAVIVLGCVIQGETPHFDYVCQGVTYGISELNTRTDGCPVIFGVLTTNTLQQALDRAGGKHGNKGVEAAITAIKMANIVW